MRVEVRGSGWAWAAGWGILGAATAGLLAFPVRHWPVDDALIHLRIVQQLLEHGTFSFNPTPTGLSTTSPLWNLVCAAATFLTGTDPAAAGPMIALSQVLAVVFSGLACAGIALLLRRSGVLLTLVGVALLATDPYLTYASASAMEMPFYVCLVVWVLFLESRAGPVAGRWVTGAVLAAAWQVRPEASVLIAGVLLHRLVVARRPFRSVLGDGLVILVFLSAWAVLYVADVGEFIPRSLLAKSTAGAAGGFLPGPARQVLRHFGQAYLPATAVLVGLAALGRRSSFAGIALPLWILFATLAGYVAFLREPSVSSRYMCTILPGLVLAITGLAGRMEGGRLRAARVAGVLLVGYSVTASLVAIESRNARGEALEPERIAIGEWIAAHTPEDALVYAHAIGYIGYYSQRACIGGAGLVDEGALGKGLRDQTVDWGTYLERMDVDYLVARVAPPVPAQPVFIAPRSGSVRPLRVWRLERGPGPRSG